MIRRREVITLIGGAAAWPLGVRAQQTTMPVIGFLNMQSPEAFLELLRGFRQGLKDTGYVEGENVAIEYRWAENQIDRLPALSAELVRRQVTVIVATGGYSSVFAAKAATTTIPIVFLAADESLKQIVHDLVAAVAPQHFRDGDEFLLEQYAQAIVAAREAYSQLQREGYVLGEKPNPWVQVLEKAHRSSVTLAGRLRLCPQMRMDTKRAAQIGSTARSYYERQPWTKD